MQTEHSDLLRHFSLKRILLPVLIGLSVAAWLFFREFDASVFENINWTWTSSAWFTAAVLMLVIRDLAYIIRIRVLTDNQLSWYRAFIVIMLWEFASALAPGIIGGGFIFAIFILNREGINMGKSITAILFSSFLDGVFLVLMAPFVYLVAGKEALFSGIHMSSVLGKSIFYSFWIMYFLILGYKLLVAYALFINPYLIRTALIRLFSLPLLNRFKEGAITTGDQLMIASEGLKDKNMRYWMWSLGSTFASWTARYSIVNFLIHAFHEQAPLKDFVVYGKQVIMGIIILLSPTPGGSGIAEYMFTDFLGEFITKGLAPSLSLLWRSLSYYPYIIVGAIILPKWIRSKTSLLKKLK